MTTTHGARQRPRPFAGGARRLATLACRGAAGRRKVGSCSKMTDAIKEILGEGDYISFSLDATNGSTDATLSSFAHAAAMLFVAGLSDDARDLRDRFAEFRPAY